MKHKFLKLGAAILAIGTVTLFGQESWRDAIPVFPEGKSVTITNRTAPGARSPIIIDRTTNAPVGVSGSEQAAVVQSESGEVNGPGKGPDMPTAPSVGNAPSAGPAPSVGKAPSLGKAPSVGTAPIIRTERESALGPR